MVHNLENSYEQKMVDMKQLPPGFRFDPTDEELVLQFLYSKLKLSSSSSSFSSSSNNNYNHLNLIPELDGFYDHYHPCQLHGEAFESCGQWYFYTKKTENRISENGYWKELIEMDQPIVSRASNKLVGLKKWFVFYMGKYPSSGIQTEWFMQEYHAFTNIFGTEIHHKRRRSKQSPDVNKWVLCRVQQIDDEHQWRMMNTIYDQHNYYNNEVELSSSDEAVLLAMDEIDQDDIISCP